MSKIPTTLSFATGIAVQRYASAEDSLSYSAENGLTHFYIDAAYPEDSMNSWSTDRKTALARAVERSGIQPIIHGNFKNPLSHELNEVRLAAVKYATREVDFAMDLDAPLIVHASGVMLHQRVNEGRAQAIKDFSESLKMISDYAAGKGVPIWVENLENYKKRHPFYTIYSTMEDYDYVLSENDYVSLMFDVGHHYISGGHPLSAFSKYSQRIAGMNFHDNDGDVDSHKPLGSGTIDFGAFVRCVRSAGWHGLVVLETRGGDILDGLDFLAGLESAGMPAGPEILDQ